MDPAMAGRGFRDRSADVARRRLRIAATERRFLVCVVEGCIT
jgi:hypothetical protein